MGEDCSSAGPDDGQLDKTRWSMVLGGVQSRAPCAQKAELCGLYWRPLYAFALRRGHSPEDAQDLVQGFFEHLIGSRLTPETLYDAEWTPALRRAAERLEQEQLAIP